jgi:quercetin dioxygenase-like cupin family protein
VSLKLQFDRIPPGVEVGPHRHRVETVVYVAAGELVYEHGPELDRRTVVGAGDVLYEAPAEYHLVRNEGRIDALALLASDPDPIEAGMAARRWDRDDEPVRRHVAARVIEGEGVRRRLLVERGDFGTPTFALEEIELDPGTVDDWHRHPGAEHALVVFQGRGIITVGRISETLEPLKGIRIEAGLPHRVENTGRTVLRYYVCGTPGTDMVSDRERVPAPRWQRDG